MHVLLWPVYTGDLCCDFKRDFAASKLLPIPRSLHREIAAKIASVNG